MRQKCKKQKAKKQKKIARILIFLFPQGLGDKNALRSLANSFIRPTKQVKRHKAQLQKRAKTYPGLSFAFSISFTGTRHGAVYRVIKLVLFTRVLSTFALLVGYTGDYVTVSRNNHHHNRRVFRKCTTYGLQK